MSAADDFIAKVLGKSHKPSIPIDGVLAFGIWFAKQPIAAKLPKGDDEVIKLKTGDVRRLIQMGYIAGLEMASK